MNNAILRNTRPLLIAALVAGACNAMAAQRLDLTSVALNAPSQTAKTILTLTGLTSDELELQYAEKLNGQNVSRFQQYYRGIPILGEAVVAKVFGDPKNVTPTAMSGVVLHNLAQDLPSIKPAISEKTALDQAKTLSRTQNTSGDKVNLYIKQGANGAAHLVYVVSFNNASAAAPSRPTYLIDATSGAVLDSWEGLEQARKFGPGDSYKKAFDTLTNTPGWDKTKASQVIGYARDVYWTEGSKLNQGACGVEKAAADLGLKAADVTAAFNVTGTCHGNVAIDTIAEAAPIDLSNAVFGNIVQMDQPKSQAAPGSSTRQPQRSISTGSLGASTGWAPLGGNVTNLGTHGTWDNDINRFAILLPSLQDNRFPINVCFNDFQVGGSGTNACTHVNGWNNLQFRYVGTGTYTSNTAFTAWTPVPGYPAVVQHNYQTTAKTIGGYTLYSQATALQKNWSVATSAGIKITEKLSVPLLEETSVEVSLGVTATVGGSDTTTLTTNFVAPPISVPAGKGVQYQLVQQWQPIRTVWSVPVQLTGTVGADYGAGQYKGHYFYGLDAAGYFYEYGTGSGAEKATIVMDQRKLLRMTVIATIVP